MVPSLSLLLLPLLGCKDKASGDTGAGDTAGADDTGTAAWRPDLVCPGDAGCESNEGTLQAGAAAVSITPTCFESWEDADDNGTYSKSSEVFHDCGCDRLCEGDEGWTAPDEGEGDGVFQAVYIAGFGQSRPANGVHDELWARAVVFDQGAVRVAVVALDLVGWFYDDVLKIREAVAARGIDVDHVIVHSTHQHEGPDTLGQWGPGLTTTGVDPDYEAYVVDRAAQAVADAVAGLTPATLYAGAVDTTVDWGDKGSRNTVRDSRDPVVIDEHLYTLHATDASGATIATVVGWANHPETVGSENLLLTSDFAHYLRDYVENGVGDRPGLGGTTVFINGTVGGLMTPLGVTVTDDDGVDWSGDTYEKADALGRILARMALDSVDGSTAADSPSLSLRSDEFYIPVENYAFQAMFLVGVFERALFNYDPDAALDDDNRPEIVTGMDYLQVGPVSMLTIPGELAPEVAIGGYDGSRVHTTQDEFIDPGNPNPPPIDDAPEGPYLKDRMAGEYQWIIGLGNDEIGYLIPPYDYELHETSPYVSEPEGDHYEETNSIGPSATPRVEEQAVRILEWAP
ncbi:MAG: neutral/alkaline non-lysosomal ceramidase N-terminal domain-containing protein [Alphaproteobacteria bacterium]|nr:neutral/alkaline non-lysosomal ceramidase N-terminal domain-containing protein [Alphaproteobacteria bacterium]